MDPAYKVYVDLATTNAVILHHQFRTEVMRVSYFHPSPPPLPSKNRSTKDPTIIWFKKVFLKNL